MTRKEGKEGGGPGRASEMRQRTKETLVKEKGWFVPLLHEKYLRGLD